MTRLAGQAAWAVAARTGASVPAKCVREGRQHDVAVPSDERAAFEVVEAEFGLSALGTVARIARR